MTTRVSICIPAYRQTKYLKKTLDSILLQQYTNYEVIITDDSPDAAVEELVRKYEASFSVRYFKNLIPLGSPKNWNHAVSFATGEYIKILHHDDWFTAPTSLGDFVALLDQHPDAGFAFSAEIIQNVEVNRQRYHFPTRAQISLLQREPTSLFCGNIIGPPSVTIIRRSSFVEYDENLIWLVDLAQYIEILRRTSFAWTEQPLIVNLVGEANQVTNDCTENSNLNLHEYFYLFDRLISKIEASRRNVYLKHLVKVLYTYRVTSTKDVRQAGYHGILPQDVLQALSASPWSRMWFLAKGRLERRLGMLKSATNRFSRISKTIGLHRD